MVDAGVSGDGGSIWQVYMAGVYGDGGSRWQVYMEGVYGDDGGDLRMVRVAAAA